jgi:hypothetical protein
MRCVCRTSSRAGSRMLLSQCRRLPFHPTRPITGLPALRDWAYIHHLRLLASGFRLWVRSARQTHLLPPFPLSPLCLLCCSSDFFSALQLVFLLTAGSVASLSPVLTVVCLPPFLSPSAHPQSLILLDGFGRFLPP